MCQNLSLQSLREAWGPWERQHTSPALHSGCIMLAKIELWYPRFGLQDIDCDPGCLMYIYVTAASQWRIVEIQLLASVGWKRGCEPFGGPCSKHVTTCLSKESILVIPFWNSKHPLPTRSLRSLRAAARSPRSALWLHHAHPFVAAEEKNLSHAEKQRVWSRSCGLEDLLEYTDCTPMWLLQTKLLASVVWQRGCQTFSCQRSLNETHCPVTAHRRFVRHVCFRNLFPPILFGIPSIHSLPEAWGPGERQHTPPALHYGCIMPISLLQLKKKTCLMQRSRGFGHRVVVSKLCYNILIVLLCDYCKLSF